MIFNKYEKNDSRWERVQPHPLCTDVPNIFTQILYTYKDNIKNLEEIENAIETGTHLGWTAEFFAEHFKNVYTVEKYTEQNNPYDPNLNFLDVYKKIKQIYSNINFFSGDSPSFLKNILTEKPNTRFVILLDAHTKESSPIIDELTAIKKYSNINEHVIIVDDTVDLGSPGWPDSSTFINSIKEINSDYNIVQTPFGRKITLIHTK